MRWFRTQKSGEKEGSGGGVLLEGSAPVATLVLSGDHAKQFILAVWYNISLSFICRKKSALTLLKTTASRFASAEANMETSGEYRITVIGPRCFSRMACSLRVSPVTEYTRSLPSWAPTIASVPSGEIAQAVTVNPRLVVDNTFVPRRRTTPVSIVTIASSGNDTHSIGGPLEIIDTAGEHSVLVFENEFIAGAPDADDAGDIARGDPLTVGGVAGDGDIVGVLGVDGDLERAIEAPENHGSPVAEKDGIRFRISGDEDSPPTLRRRHASVRLLQLRFHAAQHCETLSKLAGDDTITKSERK
nr:hypothetical protein DEO72_LG9g3547 [Ipomoea batatas]